MAQFRQSGGLVRNGVASDHVSVPIRGGVVSRHNYRRSKAAHSNRKRISIGFCVFTLSLILTFSAFFYLSLPSKGEEINRHQGQDDVDTSNDTDFLLNVTRMNNTQQLKFGYGSIVHAKDSRYWDKDDRRRDEDYSEEELEKTRNATADKTHTPVRNSDDKSSTFEKPLKALDHRANGLYNEAGRNELKTYEAEYEKSLKSTGDHTNAHGNIHRQSGDTDEKEHKILDDADDYDDGIGLQDEDDDVRHNDMDKSGTTGRASSLYKDESSSNSQHDEVIANSGQTSSDEGRSSRKLLPGKRSHPKKKKRRKFSGTCEMKMANSSSLLVEPLENRKFARFSLEYTNTEQKPIEDENWEPRFAGHQSLTEREESFVARDQKINCGFVKGPEGSPSTGFDLAEDDARYIDSCHIAVMSCIFGNSDHLRSPTGKTISRSSRKNVCFVMFVDEITLQTLSSEGQMPDPMGFIGIWKTVVVKNLPYTDMRRVGKIPKLLPHRLFPKARYSIWLDSKLRLQLDPILILEYFLWRKGHEYAISNHYDRHCLWEEVDQNKRLHKYNHTVIDEQFAFYQADGMTRFNASDPNKLLPSNVPEGSFIVRAHTPMSNLFSCLWFNEVERFTPRDQLSFAYTYHKLTRMNPEKPFYLNMFKDCERRKMAKLYRHRSVDTKSVPQHETE